MRVLVVEDEPALARQVAEALRAAGFAVDAAADGEEGHFLGDTEPYDAVILDLGLPKIDGATVLRRWRAAGRAMPVLILTARDAWSDKVAGLDAGGDDYLTKPFHMEELLARVRALVRRAAGRAEPILRAGAVELDTRTGRVHVAGRPVETTAQELKVLSYLMHHQGRAVSRTELAEHIYGHDDERDSNTIEVFVGRLRRKLGEDAIRTHRGRGYGIGAGGDD